MNIVQPQKINFQSQGESCSALHYRVQQSLHSQSEYCIVMAHGLSGVKEMRLDAYAEHFVQAGYQVLLFDYRHFGESTGQPRQLLRIKKQHQDWLAGVRYAKEELMIEESKIVLWGSSLSGGHVIEIASRLPGLGGIIAQVPHVNGLAAGLATGIIQSFKLTIAGLKDCLSEVQGRGPFYINASGEPNELALMTAEGEAAKYKSLVPKGFSFDQRVAARFVFAMSFYNPGKKLKTLSMPAFIQVGLLDKITPAKATIKDCENAKTVELKTYNLGHFEPYVDPDFSLIIADQIKFLNNITHTAKTE